MTNEPYDSKYDILIGKTIKVKWSTNIEEYFIIYGIEFCHFDNEYYYELYNLRSGAKTRWELDFVMLEILIDLMKAGEEAVVTHPFSNIRKIQVII